jgi:hypothetical protein
MFSILFGSSGEGQTPPPNCSICGLHHQGEHKMVEECSTCGQVKERHGNPPPPNCPECGHTIETEKLSEFDQLELVYVRGKMVREVCGGAVISFSTMNGPSELTIEREDYTREAVAPKPAPPRPTEWLQDVLADASKRVEDWPEWKKDIEFGATPAPGAKRLREALRLRAEELHIDQNGSGLPLKGYSDCHKHIFETCTSPKCVEVREALAAAPGDKQ